MADFLKKNWIWIALVAALVAGNVWFVTQGRRDTGLSERVPNFALRKFDGGAIYMEELRGRPVLLYFWAAWCIFCDKEMPMLERFTKEFPELVVIGVHRSETESREVAVKYAEERGITYPLVADPHDNIFNYFVGGSNIVPLSVLIDREGFVVDRIVGPRYEDQFRALIEGLLKKKD